jgi:hypothetical protein
MRLLDKSQSAVYNRLMFVGNLNSGVFGPAPSPAFGPDATRLGAGRN